MPYGRVISVQRRQLLKFQSLIWVACPTGLGGKRVLDRASMFQSLIWVACPTGKFFAVDFDDLLGFNPSYGLHALRARSCGRHAQGIRRVSIPHMGCMPYGRLRISLT